MAEYKIARNTTRACAVIGNYLYGYAHMHGNRSGKMRIRIGGRGNTINRIGFDLVIWLRDSLVEGTRLVKLFDAYGGNKTVKKCPKSIQTYSI